MTQLIFIFWTSLLMLYSAAGHAAEPAAEAEEIQILIDVSGSMKQNDPQNLRADATLLLINLLPEHARASLWLFAEKPQLLINSEAIDASWRQQAQKSSRAIHSRGLYTHIEEAIATTMQNGFAGSGSKKLILLTDGVVDISKDIMVSADSRERILSEWIPKLRERQVNVQTIALSEQADKELLEQLAFQTGGWHETAESAEQLQRLFLKMAQKVAPKDTVPLEDNHFSIDSSIQEFSVLVFKKAGAKPTALIAPDKKTINQQNALSEGIAWLDTAGYDLITVKKPQAGNWQIAAELDPDNQVMVLTDLKLKLEGLSNYVDAGAELPLNLHFTERNELITRKDFLELVSIALTLDSQPPVIIPASSQQTGYFAQQLTAPAPGKHTLTLIADGKTFKREIVQAFEVVASPIQIEKIIDAPSRQVTLKFQPDIAVLDASALAISVEIQQTDKPLVTRTVSEHDGEWRLLLDSWPPGSALQIRFNVMAKTLDGKAVTPPLAPIMLDDSVFLAHEPAPEPSAATEETPQAQPPEAAESLEKTESTEAEINWGLVVAIVLFVNLLLGGTGFWLHRLLKAANAKQQQHLLERLA